MVVVAWTGPYKIVINTCLFDWVKYCLDGCDLTLKCIIIKVQTFAIENKNSAKKTIQN